MGVNFNGFDNPTDNCPDRVSDLCMFRNYPSAVAPLQPVEDRPVQITDASQRGCTLTSIDQLLSAYVTTAGQSVASRYLALFRSV